MIRTDRKLLLTLCVLVAPLLLPACTRQDAAGASGQTAIEEAPAARSSTLQEVVITASRIDSRDEDRRGVPN